MSVVMRNALQRIARTFGAFTAGQKAVSVVSILALVVGGVLFSQWASAPTYAPLFTGLAPNDASKIVEELTASNTPYELADGGASILVPRDKVYSERVRLAGEGLPSGDTTTGYALLDKQGITASEFQQQVGFQRATEGELTKTIEAIDGVESAVVHLAIPKKDVFADVEGKPTASVLVKTRAGDDLDGEQVQAIVHLVSSSVEGLEPGKVTVSDSSGRLLSNTDDAGGAGDMRSRKTQEYETRLTEAVRNQLERVVGPGNAVVTVTADLDFDKTAIKSRRFEDPNVKPIAESTKKETYTGNGAGNVPVGVLGPDNNGNFDDTTDAAAGANAEGEGNGYNNEAAQRQNALNETNEERLAAVGSVRKLGIGVLLNAKAAGALNPKDVQDLVVSAANMDMARGDQINISRRPVDARAAKAAADELAKKEEEEKKAELMAMAKTGTLAFVIFVLLLMALLGGRKRSKAAASLRRAELEAVQKRMDQLEMERIRAIEMGSIAGELEAGDSEAHRMAQVRDEIGDLVEAQPDEVAALLRGWLADRRA